MSSLAAIYDLEGRCELRPQPHQGGGVRVVHLGRIDNRDELVRELSPRTAPLSNAAPGAAASHASRHAEDAALLACAYERWGEDFPAHVLGDFAIILWDEPRRQLFCVRDVAGVQQLHYLTDGKVFLCASEISELLTLFDSPPAPNEAMIAGLFAARIGNFSDTIYQGIFRLDPGCSLTVSALGVVKKRYWDFDPHHTVRHKSDEDYQQHFFELFRDAVRCRVPSDGKVGLLLSGGLDSSSIGGMLQHLQWDVELYSMVFPGMDCDETPYIQACSDAWNKPFHAFEAGPGTLASLEEEIARTQALPEGPSARSLRVIREHAQQQGVRVILNGWGADELLTGSQFHHADMLAHLRLPALFAQLRSERQLGRMDLARFLRHGVGPLVPAGLRRLRRRMIRDNPIPPWIDPEFAARVHLSDRALASEPLPFPTEAQRRIYQERSDPYGILDLETYVPRWADHQVEVRSPFLHRPLMEFCLAIPEEQRWRGPWTKYIVRQAMKPYVPAKVLQRTDKAAGGRAILPYFAEAGEEFFANLELAKRGWVRTDEVLKIYRDTAAGWGWKEEPDPDYSWPLWYMLSIELWLRTMRK